MSDCIFCKILRGQIPAERLFEDEKTIVIKDAYPQAPHHYLVIPKLHTESLATAFEAEAQGSELMGHLLAVGVRVARERGLLPAGFRTVINTGKGGGQSVFHLHVHLLGGHTASAQMA